MANNIDAIIRVRNLEKAYRPKSSSPGESVEVRALDGVSLDIERGDFVAIMGPSGSGKSTLMQILGLLDRKSGGEYLLDGENIEALDDDAIAELRSRKIGFIFQFFNLLPRTTSTDNVALPMLYAGRPNPTERARKLLSMVGLSERLDHKPHQLSGGQQQRVAIARSLANEPAIIFADEPTGNISSEQANEILAQLQALNDEGVTIVVVTHEPEVAEKAKRMIVLKDGKLLSDTRLKPNHPPKKKLEHVREELRKFQWKRVQENLRMAFVALSLNKLRTALATLGIIIGIASVVAMVAIGVGAKDSLQKQLSSLGTNLLTIIPMNPKTSDMSLGRNLRRFTIEDMYDLNRLIKSTNTLSSIGGVVSGNGQVIYGDKNTTTRIVGATPSYESLQNYTPIAGRFFSEEESSSRRRVVLLGQTVVRNIFGEDKNPVGSVVRINLVEFTVIGVLSSKGANAFQDQDDMVIIPLETAMFRVLGRRYVDYLLVGVKAETMIDSATETLREHIRYRRKLGTQSGDDFDIRSMNEIRDTISKSTEIMSSLLASIAAISLLVGGIGIMNVMLVSVKERTKEIGLRKALGARRQDILLQFLIEATLICLLGGTLGIFIGYSLSLIASSVFHWSSILPIGSVVLAFLFSVNLLRQKHLLAGSFVLGLCRQPNFLFLF